MIIATHALSELRKRNSSKRIGFAAGTFDLLHVGHLQYLGWAKRQCDILVAYVRSDIRVKTAKGRQPYNTEYDRALIVDSIKPVDYVVIGEKTSPKERPSVKAAMLLGPDVILIGASWASEKAMWGKSLPGIEIQISPTPHIRSSTQILLDNNLLDN